ncbi:MAG: hypothetical protein Q9N02_08160 [Ghiorsea sp.]|nr:hypothetical protein [Ghiorsea sp.]
MLHLKRRGFDLGLLEQPNQGTSPSAEQVKQAWRQDSAIVLPQLLNQNLQEHAENIKKSHVLMQNVLRSCAFIPCLEQSPYLEHLQHNFFIVAASPEEHDEQGIEKVYFDAFIDDDNTTAEELWCKASWLSFHDEDASLRFRFSWGMEGYEDVSSDPVKQDWAGQLCDAIFPESCLITENKTILAHLSSILGKKPSFVERIVYFNAPNGGAQFHHDVERGHAGVVFAQLSGATFWLTASKPKLMDEIIYFVSNPEHQAAIALVLPDPTQQQALSKLCQHRDDLSCYMEEPDHEFIEALIDRCPVFVAHMASQGFAHYLQAGDVLLLPQRDLDHCVWHSVFTIGDTPGEALSFAVR